MIKIFYGRKGMGKTKSLVDAANDLAAHGAGDVVFIDDSNQLMYDLKHQVRFINVSEFPVNGDSAFMGFLCGIIAEDYDISGIFIDGLTYIIKQDVNTLGVFFDSLKKLAAKYNTKFFITINGDPDAIPDFIKEFTV